MAYATTDVGVDKSQGEIRKLLLAHGAANFSFGEGAVNGCLWAIVEFVHHDHLVRVRVSLKEPDTKVVNNKVQRTRTRTRTQIVNDLVEQEARRIWRVLFHGLKARLVSVEEGVETFEQAFLAHLVDPVTNQTLWDAAKALIETGAMRVGGIGMEIGPPQLGPAPLRVVTPDAPSTARENITADDTAHGADDDIVDAEVVG